MGSEDFLLQSLDPLVGSRVRIGLEQHRLLGHDDSERLRLGHVAFVIAQLSCKGLRQINCTCRKVNVSGIGVVGEGVVLQHTPVSSAFSKRSFSSLDQGTRANVGILTSRKIRQKAHVFGGDVQMALDEHILEQPHGVVCNQLLVHVQSRKALEFLLEVLGLVRLMLLRVGSSMALFVGGFQRVVERVENVFRLDSTSKLALCSGGLC